MKLRFCAVGGIMSREAKHGNYIEPKEVGLNVSVKKEVSITYSILFLPSIAV